MTVKYHWLPSEQVCKVEPMEIGLQFTSFERIVPVEKAVVSSVGEEKCLVCLSGMADYWCGKSSGTAKMRDILYLPLSGELTLLGQSEWLCFSAPADNSYEFSHISFEQVDGTSKHKIYGKKETGSYRHVWNYIDESFPSDRLLVGMCMGDAGGWTAWPPHEHAEKREEVYVYFDMNNTFGIQCVYEDIDHPLTVSMVRNGHVVSVPSGYHPSVGTPGGRICYFYCMVSKQLGDRNFMDLSIQKLFGDRLV